MVSFKRVLFLRTTLKGKNLKKKCTESKEKFNFKKIDQQKYFILYQNYPSFFTAFPSTSVLSYLEYSLLKKCPYSELFWSTFSRVRTEYG